MTWAQTLSGEPGAELPEFSNPPADPLPLLVDWFESAETAGVRETRAVTLATATPDGVPSVRVLLLKSVTERGLLFGSSGASQKGRELAQNPIASVNVYWREIMRQVTVTGVVTALSDAESDLLFEDRTREARAIAATSQQSRPLDDASAFQRRVAELAESEQPIPRPAGWSAYLLVPTAIEFWQGSEDRLHRRLRYERATDASWTAQRLQP